MGDVALEVALDGRNTGCVGCYGRMEEKNMYVRTLVGGRDGLVWVGVWGINARLLGCSGLIWR